MQVTEGANAANRTAVQSRKSKRMQRLTGEGVTLKNRGGGCFLYSSTLYKGWSAFQFINGFPVIHLTILFNLSTLPVIKSSTVNQDSHEA